MIFTTVSHTPRPIRFNQALREWAYESLHGKYGDEAKTTPCVTLDHIPGFDALSDIERYDLAIREIAEKAPVRLREHEQICGSATLGKSRAATAVCKKPIRLLRQRQ